MALGMDLVTAKEQTDEMMRLGPKEEESVVAAPARSVEAENTAALAELQGIMAGL